MVRASGRLLFRGGRLPRDFFAALNSSDAPPGGGDEVDDSDSDADSDLDEEEDGGGGGEGEDGGIPLLLLLVLLLLAILLLVAGFTIFPRIKKFVVSARANAKMMIRHSRR